MRFMELNIDSNDVESKELNGYAILMMDHKTLEGLTLIGNLIDAETFFFPAFMPAHSALRKEL